MKTSKEIAEKARERAKNQNERIQKILDNLQSTLED